MVRYTNFHPGRGILFPPDEVGQVEVEISSSSSSSSPKSSSRYIIIFSLSKSSSKKSHPVSSVSFPTRVHIRTHTRTHVINQPLRSLPPPYIDAGLDELLDGGGTVGTFESAIRYCRSEVLDLLAEALKALVMSSTEKLSLRGIVDREVGSGIMSVIVVDDVVTMMGRMMMRGGWL